MTLLFYSENCLEGGWGEAGEIIPPLPQPCVAAPPAWEEKLLLWHLLKPRQVLVLLLIYGDSSRSGSGHVVWASCHVGRGQDMQNLLQHHHNRL